MDRRSTLKLMGFAAAGVLLPGCGHLREKSDFNTRYPAGTSLLTIDGQDFNPINRSIKSKINGFSGDNFEKFHKMLRDPDYLKTKGFEKVPSPSESVPLVVIGAGISGLSTSYLLRKHKPVILDRNDRFGGFSQAQSWNGIDYSIGAAYLTKPDEGSPLDKFYKEIGVDKMWKVHEQEEPVELNGKLLQKFWEGGTDPANPKQFQALKTLFADMYNGANGLQYPEMPILSTSQQEADKIAKLVTALDQYNFKEYLEKHVSEKGLGKKLHPHIETAIEHYCWSSFGASSSAVSAAAGFSFYCAEFGALCVLPGGNAAVAEQLSVRLAAELPRENFRPSSTVLKVSVVKDGALVTYEDKNQKIKTLHAKAVVMACPKFIAGHVIEGLEPERMQAIKQLKYNAYLVANVLLNCPLKTSAYDIFMLGKGTVGPDLSAASTEQGVTDVVVGTYAKAHSKKSVLTLYRGLPDGIQGMVTLMSPNSFETISKQFKAQIENEILPLFAVNKSLIQEIRLTRWGHALPQCSKGLYSTGVNKAVSAPFKDKVFFVEQDNWSLPAIETAIGEALFWKQKIEKALPG